MARSSPAPRFGSSAGARLIVTLRSGKRKPEAEMAARTRAVLSRTEACGRPTISTRGSCELIRTSTSTGTPSTPESAADQIWDKTVLPGTPRGWETKGIGRKDAGKVKMGGRASREKPCLRPFEEPCKEEGLDMEWLLVSECVKDSCGILGCLDGDPHPGERASR